MLYFANVAMPAWQAIFLILLSFGSLGIALYCLLFMVPLKKFVKHIESLGGGMEGLKKHLSGIETYFGKELERIESRLGESIDSAKIENEQQLEILGQQAEKTADTLKRFENARDALEKSVENLHADFESNKKTHESFQNQLRELQRDMSVLAEETEGKLQREVRESFYELEATVLATLEVLRDEMLPYKHEDDFHNTDTPGDTSGTHKNSKNKRENDTEDSKIISAGPLFSRSDPSDNRDGKDDSDN